MGKLKIINLLVRNGAFRLELPLLEMNRGELVCVMGKSGSGKSTLLNAIAGFQPMEAGIIEVEGFEIQKLPPELRKVALVFQRPALFHHLTVYGNVEFGLRIQKLSKAERDPKVMSWLRKLGVEALADRSVDKLSGGEAQRVALARALVVGFPVLLLDEPFTAMDVELRASARKLVKDLVRELGVFAILVSHDPEDVAAMADRVLHVVDGKIRESERGN